MGNFEESKETVKFMDLKSGTVIGVIFGGKEEAAEEWNRRVEE